MELLAELLLDDRTRSASRYAVVLVSEGARITDSEGMIYTNDETDQYGHRKLGGVGDQIAGRLKALSPKYNNGRQVNTISQRLGYLVRSGDPDATDSIVPMVFGNIAVDLVLAGESGRLVSLRMGRYDHSPLSLVTSKKKVVDVETYYNPRAL